MNSLTRYILSVNLVFGFTFNTAFAINLIPASACTTDVITSQAGPVCGSVVTSSSGKTARAFLGIPYAESTANHRRWKAPVTKRRWYKTRAALQYGPICPQETGQTKAKLLAALHYDKLHSFQIKEFNKRLKKIIGQSEDCLSLNIWTPSEVKVTTKLPVMVFIYGGGFVAGDSSDPLYDGSYLAANKDVIVVSFNYRLGVLGFLATDELKGNYGFMDQQLALDWVQDNIASFGGDPDKVTLFGESAGAMSVGLHMFSAPASQGLFRAGIMESNFLALPYKSLQDQINVGNIFKQSLNCRDLACLKKTDVVQLLKAQSSFTLPMSTVFSGAKYYIPFSPAIDGEILTRQPTVAAADDKAKKPLLIGTNKNEAVLFVAGRSINPMDYATWSASLFGLDFQKTIARYPAQNDQTNSELWARVQTDDFLRCSSRYVASRVKAPVFSYLFNHQPSFKVWGGDECYTNDNVCHGAELPFVFHSAEKIAGQFTAEERVLSERVINYWVNFASTLNPNAGSNTSTALNWPTFTEDDKKYLVFNTPNVTVQSDPYRETCEFWDGIGYNLIKPWFRLK